MKTESDFKAYFDSTIKGQLQSLKAEREKASLIRWLVLAGLLVLDVFITIYSATHWVDYPAGGFGFCVMFTALAYVMLTYGTISGYEVDFKDKIIRSIVSFIDPALEYDPETGILEPAFDMCKIFYTAETWEYDSTDHITGAIGDTNIRISRLDVKEGQNIRHTTFKGLFFIADFNKDFSGETLVLSKFLHSSFNNTVDKLHIGLPPIQIMENPEFNYYFNVYAEDPVECRYILSPALMAKMVDLHKSSPDGLCFSFARSYIFIPVFIKEDIFNSSVRSEDQYERYLSWFNDLNFTINLVDALELNKRIWSKQS